MEEALIARLLASVAIAAFIEDRVHWVDRPDDEALPALVLQLISPGREYSHDGPSGLDYPRIQFKCLGNTYKEAALLQRAVLSEMETVKEQGSVHFEDGLLVSEHDLPKETLDNGDAVFGRSMDITVPNRAI